MARRQRHATEHWLRFLEPSGLFFDLFFFSNFRILFSELFPRTAREGGPTVRVSWDRGGLGQGVFGTYDFQFEGGGFPRPPPPQTKVTVVGTFAPRRIFFFA